MRNRDHKDVNKHLAAMDRIKPLCTSKLVVRDGDDLITLRLLINWKGRRIRAGLVIGGIINGEPHLTEVGQLCLS